MVTRDTVDAYQILDLFLVSDSTKDLGSKLAPGLL